MPHIFINSTELTNDRLILTQPICMKGVSVKSLELPMTFYFTSGNTFAWSENAVATILEYVIPDGSYSTIEFMAMLTAGINSVSAYVYTMTFNDITAKFTLSVASGSFIMYFDTTTRDLKIELGMALPTGVVQHTVNLPSHTSDTIISLSGPNYINLMSDLPIRQKENFTQILERIPVSVPRFGIILYSSVGFRDTHGQKVHDMRFWLEDPQGNRITLLSSSWSMTLEYLT